MRQHYMTMCFRENIEVTYKVSKGQIIMTYEKAVNNVFHRADILLDGTVIAQDGFKSSDIDYFVRFTVKNAPLIVKIVNGEYSD